MALPLPKLSPGKHNASGGAQELQKVVAPPLCHWLVGFASCRLVTLQLLVAAR